MDHIPFNHTFFHIATVTPNWEPYDPNDPGFPHPVHHQPIGASLLRLTKEKDEDGEAQVAVTITSKVIKNLEQEERGLVAAFFEKVPGETSFLVSFNGRSFALPVMVYRALRHGVNASKYLQEQEVFTARYSSQHVDLADFLSGYGTLAQDGASLSLYAQMLGLAKRPYLKVEEAFQKGQTDAIKERLEVDVLIMAAIFFRLLLSQGRLTLDSFRAVSKLTLRKYFDQNDLAAKYLEDSNITEYFRGGVPAEKKK